MGKFVADTPMPAPESEKGMSSGFLDKFSTPQGPEPRRSMGGSYQNTRGTGMSNAMLAKYGGGADETDPNPRKEA